jgi:hypothetical protein
MRPRQQRGASEAAYGGHPAHQRDFENFVVANIECALKGRSLKATLDSSYAFWLTLRDRAVGGYPLPIVSSTAYFVCPDDNHPYGGIRVTYRFVDTLNAAGIRAAVVHRSARFRCTWFDNDTRVIGARKVIFEKGDLLVLPEWYRSSIPRFAPGVPNLVFNQNTYETFTNVSRNANSNEPVVSADTIGIVVVSDDNLKYANLCFPRISVERIKLGIDTNIFHEALEGKTKSIAFMPRKRLKELNQILHILQLRDSLEGWTPCPIQGLSETETARVLASSAVFLALNEREGFGLPPLEAMASGCAVVGFSGGVGREYMLEDCTIPISDGDVTAFVLALESILTRWGRDESLRVMTTQAVDVAKREFSRESERRDVVAVFGSAMDRVKDVEPRTRTINWRLLKPPGSRFERLMVRAASKKRV